MTRKRVSVEEALYDINDWLENEVDDEVDPTDDAVDNLNEIIGDDAEDDRDDPGAGDGWGVDFEDHEVPDEENQPQRHRKKLTKKRTVNSIDSALDPNSFDPITYINAGGEFETFTGYLGPQKDKVSLFIFLNFK